MAFVGTALVVTIVTTGCTSSPGHDVPSLPQEAPTEVDTSTTSNAGDQGAGTSPSGTKGDTKQPTEPVPPPSSGLVSQTVAPVDLPDPLETDLIAEARPIEDLTVKLLSVEAIEATAEAPGQVAGPAVAITLTMSNSGSRPVDAAGVEVNLEDANGNPGAGMIDAPAAWFEGEIDPGGEIAGVYVFSVAETARDPIQVSVTVRPGAPAVVFSGAP